METLTETPDRILTELGLVASRTEGRRLVDNGSVKLNDVPVTSSDDNITVNEGDVVKVGRRKMVEITQGDLDRILGLKKGLAGYSLTSEERKNLQTLEGWQSASWFRGFNTRVPRVVLTAQERNNPYFMKGFNGERLQPKSEDTELT